jgi:methionyl-tRNA synthetase
LELLQNILMSRDILKETETPNTRDRVARKIGIFVAWPYSNGPRHVGHGASLLPADVVARYERGVGSDVLMISGTDEYGTPNLIAAEKKGMSPTDFADMTSSIIRKDFIELGMSFDLFTHTTSPNHTEVAQNIFANLVDSGYISIDSMNGSFDSVTSQALPDRYVEGICPVCGAKDARGDQCDNCTSLLNPTELIEPHSSLTKNAIELKPTPHYFLNLDMLKDEVEEYINSNPNLRTEAKTLSMSLVSKLRPRAITRDLSWGIPLPEGYEISKDDHRVLYVWFEAVIGYLSASIEWAKQTGNPESWKYWWEESDKTKNYYFMGKDNVPFHTIIWPAILAAKNHNIKENEIKLKKPDVIASTGNLNFAGTKFSTSRGNVAYIKDILQVVGPDALRFYLILAGPENHDSNFTIDDLVQRYNGELLTKWGNLISRVTNLIDRDFESIVPSKQNAGKKNDNELLKHVAASYNNVGTLIERGKLASALKEVLGCIAHANKYIVDEKPWEEESKKTGRNEEVLTTLSIFIENTNKLLCPFIPHSSQKISDAFGSDVLISSMPIETNNLYGQKILTGNYTKGLEWKYSKKCLGNSLTKGKAVIFPKFKLEDILENFNKLNSNNQ